MAWPRARAAALLLLFLRGSSALAATTLPSNDVMLSNTPSSEAVGVPVLNISSNDNEYGACFNPPTPRRGLYPAKEQDCLNAAEEVFYIKNPFRDATFGRTARSAFRLPKVVRNRTCVISIDVMNDADTDVFKPWLVYATARALAHECTQGAFPFGGRAMAGPLMVVDVLVFGRVWPLESGRVEPVVLESPVVTTRGRLGSGDPSLPNETSFNLADRLVGKTTSRTESLGLSARELGGTLKCYDPPLPRERVWSINVKDCEMAADAIFGDRAPEQSYTFSRAKVATKFHYPLPATFRYKSCVVHLDMNNNSDQDTVRLRIVEATAWVLAHKCSGEETSVEQYGGRATVGVGSKDLINVWVYGRPWPPTFDAANVTTLALVQSAPLTDSE